MERRVDMSAPDISRCIGVVFLGLFAMLCAALLFNIPKTEAVESHYVSQR